MMVQPTKQISPEVVAEGTVFRAGNREAAGWQNRAEWGLSSYITDVYA